jgi:hypothetical protein
MRKAILTLASILLLAAGGGIGWFAAKQGADTQGGQPGSPAGEHGAAPGKPVVHFRAGDPELLAPMPSWEEWKYPGSRVSNSSTGESYKVGEIMEFSTADRVTLLTPDEFEKVWAFYKGKCKLRDPGDACGTLRYEVAGTERSKTVKLFDDIRAHSFEGLKSEAVQARAFSVQTLRYSLAGFVYRPRESESTCIQLVYRPNTEFMSLVKDKMIKD